MRRSRKGKLTGKSSRVGKIRPVTWKREEPKHFATVQEAYDYANHEGLTVTEQVSIKDGQLLNVIDSKKMVQTLTILKKVPEADVVASP